MTEPTALDGPNLQTPQEPKPESEPLNVRKALLTAAGRKQRTLPLQSLVDRDGEPKTALWIILDEVVAAGVDEIGIVVRPGDEPAFAAAAGPHEGRLRFINQSEPLGYGHAVLCGKEFVGDAPFLLLVGDHLYVSHSEKSCAQQLIEVASGQSCPVSAVQASPESKLPYYGVVGGRLEPGRRGVYLVEEMLEKPTPTEAEQRLMVPGLRAGHYLCFFGMHALSAAVMGYLEEIVSDVGKSPLPLTPALARLADREKYLAAELAGNRYDLGQKYGLLTAQMALALDGRDRSEVLAQLVELMAQRLD